MNVGTGSRLQVFGADARIVRRNSSLVTGLKMDKPQFVSGKVGGGQPAVASRTDWTLVVKASKKASAVKSGAAWDGSGRERPKISLKVVQSFLGSPE